MLISPEEREERIALLLRLVFLPVQDRPDLGEFDASFEKLRLAGEFGRLLLSEDDFAEFLRRKASISQGEE